MEADAQEPERQARQDTTTEWVKTTVFVAIGLVSVLLGWLALQRIMGTAFPLLVVKSGSMHPTIEMGDIIGVVWVEPYDIKSGYGTGDVIVFYKPGEVGDTEWIIVHRAIQRSGSGFVTKGDNNQIQDSWSPVPYDHLLGKWNGFKIPYWMGIGFLVLILRGEMYAPAGTIIIIAVVALNVLILGRDVFGSIRRRSNGNESQSPDHESEVTGDQTTQDRPQEDEET